MIFLEFFDDYNQGERLEEQANALIDGLTLSDDSFEKVKYGYSLIFHTSLNKHHFEGHATPGRLFLKDLLIVSSSYVEQLAEVYDAILFKETFESFRYSREERFFQELQKNQKRIENYLFLINVSEILSCHLKNNKKQYTPAIEEAITIKNIQAIARIQKKLAFLDEARVSLILGKNSPYEDQLCDEEFHLRDCTGTVLLKTTKKAGCLVIPKDIDISERNLSTPNFLIPFECNGPYKSLLERQINLFLPARQRLEKEFWERYEGVHCDLQRE